MAPLDGTEALAEMNGVFPVGQHLEFHVLRTLNVLLNENPLVAEG